MSENSIYLLSSLPRILDPRRLRMKIVNFETDFNCNQVVKSSSCAGGPNFGQVIASRWPKGPVHPESNLYKKDAWEKSDHKLGCIWEAKILTDHNKLEGKTTGNISECSLEFRYRNRCKQIHGSAEVNRYLTEKLSRQLGQLLDQSRFRVELDEVNPFLTLSYTSRKGEALELHMETFGSFRLLSSANPTQYIVLQARDFCCKLRECEDLEYKHFDWLETIIAVVQIHLSAILEIYEMAQLDSKPVQVGRIVEFTRSLKKWVFAGWKYFFSVVHPMIGSCSRPGTDEEKSAAGLLGATWSDEEAFSKVLSCLSSCFFQLRSLLLKVQLNSSNPLAEIPRTALRALHSRLSRNDAVGVQQLWMEQFRSWRNVAAVQKRLIARLSKKAHFAGIVLPCPRLKYRGQTLPRLRVYLLDLLHQTFMAPLSFFRQDAKFDKVVSPTFNRVLGICLPGDFRRNVFWQHELGLGSHELLEVIRLQRGLLILAKDRDSELCYYTLRDTQSTSPWVSFPSAWLPATAPNTASQSMFSKPLLVGLRLVTWQYSPESSVFYYQICNLRQLLRQSDHQQHHTSPLSTGAVSIPWSSSGLASPVGNLCVAPTSTGLLVCPSRQFVLKKPGTEDWEARDVFFFLPFNQDSVQPTILPIPTVDEFPLHPSNVGTRGIRYSQHGNLHVVRQLGFVIRTHIYFKGAEDYMRINAYQIPPLCSSLRSLNHLDFEIRGLLLEQFDPPYECFDLTIKKYSFVCIDVKGYQSIVRYLLTFFRRQMHLVSVNNCHYTELSVAMGCPLIPFRYATKDLVTSFFKRYHFASLKDSLIYWKTLKYNIK